MANKQIAVLTYQSALKFQQRFSSVHSPLGLVAQPNFKSFSMATVEHLLDCTSQTPSEIAVWLSTPIEWVCNGKKGRNVEESFKLAATARRAKIAVVALPSLVGSTKQVAWAEKIRDRHAMKDPSSPYLKSCINATWWINNKNDIL